MIPDQASAATLWEALDTNAPLQLTGEEGANGGVIADPSAPTPAPSEPAPEASTPAPDATDASAAPGVVELPSNVSGTKANQATCSAGNG